MRKEKNRLRYLYSLVPKIHLLKDIESIHIIDELIGTIPEKEFLELENSINVHIFKPKYIVDGPGKLKCYVATRMIAHHVRRALIYICRSHNINMTIECTEEVKYIEHVRTKYGEEIDSWVASTTVHSEIVLCNIQSVLSFLRVMTLINKGILASIDGRNLLRELELSRLNGHMQETEALNVYENYLNHLDVLEIFAQFPHPTNYLGDYFININVKFLGREFSLFQLPWGNDLSHALTSSILKTEKAGLICVIGGSAFTGNQNVKVDDIFIPASVEYRDCKIEFQNVFLNLDVDSQFYKKNVIKGGLIKSVDSSIGDENRVLSMREFCDVNNYSGFDMEAFGVVSSIAESKKNVQLAYIFYIMDLPAKGIGLGTTYYSKAFLKRLFQSKNRGKFYAFEKFFIEHSFES